MFRFGPTHRGRSPFVLPAAKPAVWWTFATSGPIVSSPALAATAPCWWGRRTARCTRSRATARCEGRTRRVTSFSAHPPSAHDGTIYIGSDDDHLYALLPGVAKPRWIVQMGACPQRVGIGPEASRCDVDAGPTIGPDGVIYTGRRRHLRHQPGRHAALALRDRRPRLLGARGASRRDRGGRQPGRSRSTPSPPPARSAGTSAPAATSRRRPPSATTARSTSAPTTTSCTRWAPTAPLRWAFTTGGDVRASAAVGNGVIYVGSFDAQMYAIRLDGTPGLDFPHRRPHRVVRAGRCAWRHPVRLAG